jgi:hypothetical protein
MKNVSMPSRFWIPGLILAALQACSSASVEPKPMLPDWVTQSEVLFPKERYVSAVGTGSSLELAAQSARRMIAEGFRSQINTEAKSESSSQLVQGTDGLNSGSAQERYQRNTAIQSQFTLRGADVRESYFGPDKVYALVAIDKLAARASILSEMMLKEKRTKRALDVAASGKVVRLQSIEKARKEFAQYEILAGEAVALQVATGDRAQAIAARLDALQAEYAAQWRDMAVQVQPDATASEWNLQFESCLSSRGIPIATEFTEKTIAMGLSVRKNQSHMAVKGFVKMQVELVSIWNREGKRESVVTSKTESGRTEAAAIEALKAGLIEEHCNKVLERM